MRPVPVAFHIWFVEIHTYGIGLALTFWFGLRYTERRLRNAGYPWQWVTGMFLWVIVAAIVGARAMHVIANFGFYSHNPGQIVAIWQGGLSSFGGLMLAVPVGIVSSRRRCPQLPTMRFVDLMVPVLMASWALGRLLGPQLMRAGGGHQTQQWFGMYYADQVGKRLPVPLFQAAEDFAIFCVLLLVGRWLLLVAPSVAAGGRRHSGTQARGAMFGSNDLVVGEGHQVAAVGGGDERGRSSVPTGPSCAGTQPDATALPPAGIVLGVGMALWGIERFVDEYLWLGQPGHLGSQLVQLAGIALSATGIVLLAVRYPAFQRWRLTAATGVTAPDPSADAAADAASDAASDQPRSPGRGSAGARSDRGAADHDNIGQSGWDAARGVAPLAVPSAFTLETEQQAETGSSDNPRDGSD